MLELYIWENISLWEGLLVIKEYFTLGGCTSPERIFHFGRVCWSWKNISLWEGVLVLKEVKYSFRTTTPSQSEIFSQIYNNSIEREYFTLGGWKNISLWEGVLVLKEVKYSFSTTTPSQSEIFSQIYNNSIGRENFTLGGCPGPERIFHFFHNQDTLPKWNKKMTNLWKTVTSLIMVRFSIREKFWKALDLLYQITLFKPKLHILFYPKSHEISLKQSFWLKQSFGYFSTLFNETSHSKLLLRYNSHQISLREGVLVLKEVKHYFRTTTPFQSEIFSLYAVIVDLREYCTLGGCAGPERRKTLFQDHYTLPKWNIISLCCYCRFERIFHFGRVRWSWKKWNILSQCWNCIFERIFHFGRVRWSWKKWNIISGPLHASKVKYSLSMLLL